MSDPLPTSGSLRRRLTLQLVGSAAVLATLLFFVVLAFARDVAQQTHDSILLASATSIMDSVSVQADAVTVDLPYAALSMLGNVSNDRVFYSVSMRGQLLTGYDDLPISGQMLRSGQSAFDTLSYKGDSIRMVTLSRRLSLNGAPADILITVAQTREGQAAQLAQLSRSALQLGLGFFLVATILAIWTAQSSIRPLNQLTAAVSRRGPKDLRPVRRPVPSEMIPLVLSLNQFIARLRVSLTRSEDFIAEAAHRVRTPLATVRAQAEITLLRVEKPENRASLREMIRAIDESSRAAGQLLDHAMVTFRIDSLERKAIDLAELAKDLVDRLQPIAELKDIDLSFTGSHCPAITGDAILVQNAVRNILDNAIKYSPSDRAIQVTTRQTTSAIVIQVEDQAGGFAGMDTEALTHRFTRGDNAVGTVGSGLGLTIAREVVEAHGGTLLIETNKSRTGACVSLCFPLV
ncbi:sensor histidine kinase [Parasedimentitalea psychrophila]|uniref:histidine kinase n=1 Tax=Parasedimentitalea psychrophila TaxID=2997337 RepID=A0A9Y2KZ89_9RHOB|nr:sensor histidine kinase [Parasedimentitalea psychrophila]WIY25841.1 sensor histidine kinase [Parasedimentitalea psychrophila]